MLDVVTVQSTSIKDDRSRDRQPLDTIRTDVSVARAMINNEQWAR